MVKWADPQGHFLFAPEALNGSEPYIDRLQVQINIPLPSLSAEHFAPFLDHLRGDVFCARHGNSSLIRSQWLFGGSLQLIRTPNSNSASTLQFSLKLNPTRFLQAHDVPNSIQTRNAILETPRSYLSKEYSPTTRQRLRDAKAATFDRNSNFILHRDRLHGPIRDWPTRTSEYLEAVYAFIRTQLTVAYNRLSLPMQTESLPDVEQASFSLTQIELYWEFAVDNATQKMVEISDAALALLRNSFATEYPIELAGSLGHERSRNSRAIRGHFGHQDIQAKLYSKASHIIRFELSFSDQPLRTLTGVRRRETVSRNGLSGLRSQIELMSQEADHRGRSFWREFWHSLEPTPPPDRIRLRRFLSQLSWATHNTPISSAELLSMLIDNQSVEPFMSANQGPDPVRQLKEWGVLSRRPNSPPARPVYEVSHPYRSVVRYIRDLPEEQSSGTQTETDVSVLSFEDTLQVRVRPRTISRLEE